MKTTWKISLLGASALVLTIAGLSAAGSISTTEVSIFSWGTPATLVASGTVAGAHGSSDAVQRIYCMTTAVGSGSDHFGFCFAMDANNRRMLCTTYSARQLAVMQSIGPASAITFSAKSDGARCEQVTVMNGSPYARY
jgi:hypothetical protein